MILPRYLALLALVAGCTQNPPPVSAPPASPAPSARSASKPPAPVVLRPLKKASRAMNEHIASYAWVRAREKTAVYLARVTRASVVPGDPGQRITTLILRLEATLSGPPGDELRKAIIVEPASATTRLKFPDPTWGSVEPQEGALLLLVTTELGTEVRKPLYVEKISNPEDPVLVSFREVLEAEGSRKEGYARRRRYLGWLTSGSVVPKLFGAEALARDKDLPEIDPRGEIAVAFAKSFEAEKNVFVRLNLGEWMWAGIYSRTNSAGKVAILNATLRGAADPTGEVRRLCLDKLPDASLRDLDSPSLVKVPAAIPFLEGRLAEEMPPEPRARLKKLLDFLRR
jgi:hypothetical protein